MLVRKVAALGVDVVGGVAAGVERAEGGEERRGAQGAAADRAGAQRVEGIEDAEDGGLGVPLQEAGGIAKKREGGVALGDGFGDVEELGGAHRRAVVGRREAGEQPRLGGDAGEAPREKRLEGARGGGALAAAGGAAGELRRAERRGEPPPEGAAEEVGSPPPGSCGSSSARWSSERRAPSEPAPIAANRLASAASCALASCADDAARGGMSGGSDALIGSRAIVVATRFAECSPSASPPRRRARRRRRRRAASGCSSRCCACASATAAAARAAAAARGRAVLVHRARAVRGRAAAAAAPRRRRRAARGRRRGRRRRAHLLGRRARVPGLRHRLGLLVQPRHQRAAQLLRLRRREEAQVQLVRLVLHLRGGGRRRRQARRRRARVERQEHHTDRRSRRGVRRIAECSPKRGSQAVTSGWCPWRTRAASEWRR